MKEETLVDLKKKVINEVVQILGVKNPNLYYVDSSTISSMIRDYIHEKNLSHNKYELVKDLSESDILILMSYNSNCC